MNTKTDLSIPEEVIVNKIFLIRNKKVMIDKDLAELYEVETKQLKRAVRRNIDRFPEDFMFELSEEEFTNLRCQFGTSSWGGSRVPPMVFTEQGVAMLSSVLSSSKAIKVNIQIIRIFTKMRELLSTRKEIIHKLEKLELNDLEQDEKIWQIFEYLKQLEKNRKEEVNFRERQKIGYRQKTKA